MRRCKEGDLSIMLRSMILATLLTNPQRGRNFDIGKGSKHLPYQSLKQSSHRLRPSLSHPRTPLITSYYSSNMPTASAVFNGKTIAKTDTWETVEGNVYVRVPSFSLEGPQLTRDSSPLRKTPRQL